MDSSVLVNTEIPQPRSPSSTETPSMPTNAIFPFSSSDSLSSSDSALQKSSKPSFREKDKDRDKDRDRDDDWYPASFTEDFMQILKPVDIQLSLLTGVKSSSKVHCRRFRYWKGVPDRLSLVKNPLIQTVPVVLSSNSNCSSSSSNGGGGGGGGGCAFELQQTRECLEQRGGGHHSVRGSMGVSHSFHYFEVSILETGASGTVRVGIVTSRADLNAGVGYDAFGYAFSPLRSCILHLSKSIPVGMADAAYSAKGSVIGVLLCLPNESEAMVEMHLSEDMVSTAVPTSRNADSDASVYAVKAAMRDKFVVVQELGEVYRKRKEASVVFFHNGMPIPGARITDLWHVKYYPAVSIYGPAKAVVNFGSTWAAVPDVSSLGIDISQVRPWTSVVSEYERDAKDRMEWIAKQREIERAEKEKERPLSLTTTATTTAATATATITDIRLSESVAID
eukprot:ANDGO_07123.mRNA.1 Protein TRAUCO